MLPLLFALLVIAAAGGAAAIVVANRDSVGAARVVRVTVTRSGTTVLRTVTTHASPPPATTAAGGTAAAAAGYAKMHAGDYAGALPLLEQAAQRLRGDHSLDEAYNDFNLALTLAKTQGCSDLVLRLLDESQAIQGRRTPIDELRAACTTPSPAPPGHARGPKPGKGPKHRT
jgi:hypothetical protein